MKCLQGLLLLSNINQLFSSLQSTLRFGKIRHCEDLESSTFHLDFDLFNRPLYRFALKPAKKKKKFNG
uniref:Putative ovule protein n=1 Tax=Solanum chacoense TaxID=4108 RepID=A0A0V0GIW5_SOLCH